MEVPESVNWESSRSEPWRVAAAWALDLPQYNEWMNEEDYEVDASGKKKVRTSSHGRLDAMPGPSFWKHLRLISVLFQFSSKGKTY